MKRSAVVALMLLSSLTGAMSAASISLGGLTVAGQGQVSAVAGVATITFNNGQFPWSGPLSFSGGRIVVGNIPNITASPLGNTSMYWNVGQTYGTQGVVTFNAPADYVGFYWGSPDAHNLLQLFHGDTLVGQYRGSELGSSSGSFFFNYYAGSAAETVTRAVFLDREIAFETDNFAYRLADTNPPVPEPGTWAMFGIGLAGLAVWSRSQRRTDTRS